MGYYTKVRRRARHLPFPWMGTSFSNGGLMVLCVILMVFSSFRPQVFESTRIATADFFSTPLAVISYPFQKTTLMLHDITDFAQLQADNLRLENDNIRLRQWYQTALLLDSENRALRELLNLRFDSSYTHIAARILADSGNTYVKSILIGVGENDGVKKDAAVMAGEGLIGRVVEVGKVTSRVLLVNDINSRVPIVVEDTGQHAIMAGANENNPHLIHVPEESEIFDGTRIITSGYGGVFPHGLPVGRVQLDKEGQMNIILFSDFNKLQIVRVLQKNTAKERIR
ncbi:MAG: rod shape-determining protein MreC [Alphaproteobacteria bacterium]|nr:rod shape-determining protein MreC [Alphaproteobacteria bacterium]